MWRLVVSEPPDGIRFSICRPYKRLSVLREDCPWSVSLKKHRNWREKLVSDEFLFLVIAGLHEQLPLRDFNVRGENLSRPEPRIKSERLENPPQMARGKLKFDTSSGRMLFTPFNKLSDSLFAAESAQWWFQTESKNRRLAAFEELVAEDGYSFVLLAQPRVDTRAEKAPPSLAAPQPTAPKPTAPKQIVTASLNDVDATQEPRATQNLLENFWGGLWKGEATVGGLPVEGELTSRIPSTFHIGFNSNHALWRSVSAGLSGQYVSEKEVADLRVNTSLSGQTQLASGERTTLKLAAHLNFPFACAAVVCRTGMSAGLARVQTSWKYDRELTTLNVWTPTGSGNFIEPWLEFGPATSNRDGFKGRASYIVHEFGDAKAKSIGLEAGWLWHPTWARAQWGMVKLSGWQTLLGYRTGEIRKSNLTRGNETGTNVAVNAFWFGLGAELEETDESEKER